MSPESRIVFDTSGINALEDEGPKSEPLMRALACGFEPILTAMSVEEVVSTKDAVRREALLARCQRLLSSGICIWAPHEVIRLLVAAHSRAPARFDWRLVAIRARVYEAAVIRRDFDEELCAQQRKEQFKVQEEFARFWKKLRPKLDSILAKDPAKRPVSYHQALNIATADGGSLWAIGQGLYRYVAGRSPTEAEIREFMEACPPFRAACYAMCGAWYDLALKPLGQEPPLGRNDLMMAAYLPYCGRFVTNDWPQEKRLAEIAAEGRIGCKILSYEGFCASLEITGSAPARFGPTGTSLRSSETPAPFQHQES